VKPHWITGELVEINFLIKLFCGFVDLIQDYSDESKLFTGIMTISQGGGQLSFTNSLSFERFIDSKTGENGHGQ